ncbi:Multimeric flavodoxin WrbA [Methanobrevibacter gottschalkii]|uniref:Multimeric flavodoxin WrbA n=1 Tax=Methanobrevibacter gottschalkii TaxID=190974 RepID=A0A1H7PAB8_9EURY|nr:flavodoxin family protein [Methanobrevibacter gottschalkii]MCQ2971546.1 flavodoxin family protein [archaeon]SEL32027.1 Multimeric flavodoxin WrbA [Methanobrevibacter gottschalkii]
MKVLLVNGSPNRKGCTYTALSEVAKVLNEHDIETEIFWIKTKPITGCTACGTCATIGKCTYDADSVNEFVEKAYEADAFVFGSPVYYASANGSMVSFLDRAFYSNSHGKGAEAFKHKPGAVICSARRGGTTATYDQLIKYLGISQMPIISSFYWNMVHGNTPEEVLQDEEGLGTMRQLAHNMAFFLQCLEAGAEKGLKVTEEPKPRTNFIR